MTDQKLAIDERKYLDPIIPAETAFSHGMVRLSLNPKGDSYDDPFRIWMTPGQAMTLMENLSRACRMALQEHLS